MTEFKRIDPGVVTTEMKAFQERNDSKGFILFAEQVKKTALELLNEQDAKIAAELLKNYSVFFEGYENSDPGFTYAILPLFPENKSYTMSLLGINEQIDDAIIHYKLDKRTFSRAKYHGMKYIAEWAINKGDMRYLEAFISHVVNDLLVNHSDNKSIHTAASGELIAAIVWDDKIKSPISKQTDQAIASLVTQSTSYRVVDDYWLKMARCGLHETTLMMMKHKRVNGLTKCSPEDLSVILSMLPKDPTPEQAHWITQSVPHPELQKRILFSSDFDLDSFIVAMSHRHNFNSPHGDLTFKGLSVFKEFMTPEHLDTPEKKRRVAKLLDCAAENHLQGDGLKKTTKYVREEFDKQGLPQTALRIMRMFKAQQLEDELGM